MKIGITCHASTGGSGILATELGIALAERGHVVHFVTFETPFRLSQFHDNVFTHHVTTVAYPVLKVPPGGLFLATTIANIAEEHGIDMWHAHYAVPNAVSAIIGRDMLPPGKRFKLVTTLHGTDITLVGIDPSLYRITQYAMERSDAVTAVSNWLARETEREFGLESAVRTIYNFVDYNRFRGDAAPRCCLKGVGEKRIMHVSNFRPVKRVTDVVRVFRKILDQVPVRLIMVGEGPERLSAVSVAKQLGVLDKIDFVGVQENIEDILPCADVVLQPSEHESFGLVPLEAMTCEVPVIATASGGVCEVIEHAVTGYLCEVGDTDTMARHALEILTNPERAREVGRRGRARAIALFAKDKIVGEYERLYDEVLKA